MKREKKRTGVFTRRALTRAELKRVPVYFAALGIEYGVAVDTVPPELMSGLGAALLTFGPFGVTDLLVLNTSRAANTAERV